MIFSVFGFVAMAAIFALVFYQRSRMSAAGAVPGYGPEEADRIAMPEGGRLRAEAAKGQLSELVNWIGALPPGFWSDRAFVIDLFGPFSRLSSSLP
jgi:hypothetical protein